MGGVLPPASDQSIGGEADPAEPEEKVSENQAASGGDASPENNPSQVKTRHLKALRSRRSAAIKHLKAKIRHRPAVTRLLKVM